MSLKAILGHRLLVATFSYFGANVDWKAYDPTHNSDWQATNAVESAETTNEISSVWMASRDTPTVGRGS